MDIKKIVEKRLFAKHRYFHSKSGDVHEVVMQKDLSVIASQISSDIKKELKLVASGRVEIKLDMSYLPDGEGDELYLGGKDIGEILHEIWNELEDKDNQTINIYIEEIDNG